MAISNATQFRLLLWKNWLLQKRRVVVTTLQILLPPLFAFIVLLLRMPVDSEFISTPKIWDSFDPLTLPPELTPTPTPPDLMKFNFSSFNVSTLPSNLPNQEFDSGSFDALTLPPELTPTPPDLMEFNFSSFNVSTLPFNLPNQDFDSGSLEASTLPPKLTPTPPDLMEFNFSSFNVSTLPSNLPNQDFDSGSFDASTLPPGLTPTPPDLMEFNLSSFNVSTLPSNLPNQEFDSGSFEASTLPPKLTVPNQAGNMTWMLVYSPNTSHAATRIAQVVTRILDITPFPIGTVHHYIHTYITICIARCVDSTEYMSNQRRWRQSLADYLLMLLTIFFYLTCEVSFIFSEVTRVTRYQSVTPKIILRLDLVIRSE